MPTRQPDAEEIEWRRIHGDVQRVRLVDRTCACKATVYELCAAGGQRFIRRTTGEQREVQESPRMVCRAADELWERVLTGQAR